MVKLTFLILSSWFVFNTCIDLIQGCPLFERQRKTIPGPRVGR
jgi:hypothetical protein